MTIFSSQQIELGLNEFKIYTGICARVDFLLPLGRKSVIRKGVSAANRPA